MIRSHIYKLLLAGFVITIVCASTVGIRGQSGQSDFGFGSGRRTISEHAVDCADWSEDWQVPWNVPSSSQGPPIDPAKGYRVQDLESGLYMITDNANPSDVFWFTTAVWW